MIKDGHKNTLLFTSIVMALASLPMTWFHVANVTPTLSPGLDSVFGDFIGPMTFDVTGWDGNISMLGGLPLWGAISIVILGATVQLIAKTSIFEVPLLAQLILAVIGVATVSLPLSAGFTADVTPRIG